jgi:hypothetical protein
MKKGQKTVEAMNREPELVAGWSKRSAASRGANSETGHNTVGFFDLQIRALGTDHYPESSSSNNNQKLLED